MASFNTTHWSLIVALPGSSDEQDRGRAREALEHLCTAYWRPLYGFARYCGHNAEDAQDLTQAFLASVIDKGGLGGADPDRGRFRSYLLGAMKHFMSHERERMRAKKRGGGQQFMDEDITELESRIHADLATDTTTDAERAFDLEWAHQTTASALEQLAAEWAARGRSQDFAALRPTLTGEGPNRSELAEALGVTETAAGVAIHRLRQRYATLVREAVSRTVANEADIEDEMRYLVGVLRKK